MTVGSSRSSATLRRPAPGPLGPGRVSSVARQGQPVRVHAARGDADQRVAGLDRRAGDDASSATRPKHGRKRSKPYGDGWPLISSGSCASSPPGISTPACSAPARRPTGDVAQHLRLGVLDREVVEQRDRLGADADEVVHVHRDAVDPDGVEAPACSATITFEPTPSVPKREPEVRRRSRSRWRSGPGGHDARGPARCRSSLQDTDERRHARARRRRVSTPARAYASLIAADSVEAAGSRARPARPGRPRRGAASGRARPGG